ncbi:hypothetical protein CALCODRAFT_525823 [Calocera cornea HHB12733]|uniref:Nudix hydrolase domain-containing protein n=1 Tax=Calocera cornea HHB12733 TaxID=1353952 RepID=A0A165CH54_9BASI|nr:hypothetical protein CALCODRAFT_525823 [Calocera cornea HHB12733]
MAERTLLPFVEAVDNFDPRYAAERGFARWYLDETYTTVIGLIPQSTLQAMRGWMESHGPTFTVVWDETIRSTTVAFSHGIDSPKRRTEIMKDLCEEWRDGGLFPDEIGGRKWRNEQYTVYYHPYADLRPENVAFTMERAACKLFGVVTYGVHMTMYRRVDGEVRIWVPTRSRNKQTWPLYLDNSVAGGIPHGMSPLDSMVKECEEEASLPPDLVRAHIKQVSSISYFTQNAEKWLEPEVQYVYEMFLPDGVDAKPAPSDGEVESFEMCNLDDILEKMHAGKFKPNCGAVIIDFMIRHGYLTAENEPNYLEIITRLHRRAEGYGPVPKESSH